MHSYTPLWTLTLALLALTGCNRFNPASSTSRADWYRTMTETRPDQADADTLPKWQTATQATVYVTATDSDQFGSGFIIHPAGYVVTNRHVVMTEGATEYEVSFNKGESTYTASLVSLNQCDDLALLKINNSTDQEFPHVTFGPRAKLGEPVWLAGYPGDRREIVLVQGNVAQLARREIRELLGAEDIIALSQRLGGGSSGGPVYNENQEVIGISYAIDPTSGFDDQYAIRSQALESALPRMLTDKYIHGWGFDIDSVNTTAIRVSQVYPGSPASELGLEPGDRITAIEGISFGDQALRQYCLRMRESGIDAQPLQVTVDRGGQEYKGTIHQGPLTPTGETLDSTNPLPDLETLPFFVPEELE